MEVDSKGFVKAEGDLSAFEKILNKVTGTSNKTEQSIGGLDSIFQKLNASAILASAGVLTLVNGLKEIAQGAISNYAHFESMQMKLETFYHSADKGKAVFENLRKLSNETTFGVDELADAYSDLANGGFETSGIEHELVVLGNLAQGNKTTFKELSTIFSKIVLQGKAGSMSLQQIQNKGIPINKTLKEMGVTGTASAKQVAEAFEKLTSEGGQFEGAMDNINKTIEGKEGFISDYFKEFTVNFAEASGLADTYKATLDVLKEAIGKMSEAMSVINENPFLKALLQGLIVGALTAIAGVILGTLIPAVISLIGQLTILQSLSGPLGWATLSIAGVTALGAGIFSLINSEKEVNKQLNEQIKKRNLLATFDTSKGDSETNKNIVQDYADEMNDKKKEYENLQKYVTYLEAIAPIVERMEQLSNTEGYKKSSRQSLSNGYEIGGNGRLTKRKINYTKEYTEYQNLLKQIDSMMNLYGVKDLSLEGDTLDNLTSGGNNLALAKAKQDLKVATDNYNVSKDAYEKLVASDSIKENLNSVSSFKNLSDELKELQKDLLSVNEAYKQYIITEDSYDSKTGKRTTKTALKINQDSVYKNSLDTTKNSIQNKIDDIKMLGWQKTFANKMGWENNRASLTASGNTAISNMLSDFEKQETNANTMEKMLGLDSEGVSRLQERMKLVKDMMNEMLAKGELNADSPLTQKLAETYNQLSDEEKSARFKEQTKNGTIDALKNGASSVGGDVGTFASTLAQTGNVFLAIINTVIGAIVNVMKELDGFDEAMSPVTALFRKMKPFLQVILDIIVDLEDFADDVLTPLMGIINAIGVVLKIVWNVLSPVVKFITTLGGLFTWLTDIMEEFGLVTEDTTESEEESDLTEAYKNLIKAMKENQEYYEQRKRELNAKSYSSDVTGVHDMILTPQGQFSTDPDDYIIASKNPSALGSGGGVYMNVNISNTMADSADVSVQKGKDANGNEELFIQISKKVADDYANGSNGWDNALAYQQYRQAGRSLVN